MSNPELTVRPAVEADLSAMMAVYDAARRFMRKSGNMRQWINGYPSLELVSRDIRRGQSFVCIREEEITAVFCFFVGDEPSYHEIREGAWLNDAPYGVVHRLGASGTAPGAGRFCLDWSFARCKNLRIDTHGDNLVMQHVLEKNGFHRCGLITIEDGTRRVAFQKSAE